MAHCNRIVQRLSLPTKQTEKVTRRGNELYRMSKIKMPTLGNYESCRAALCVDIALGDDMTTTTAQILQRLSTVNTKMYQQMMSRLQTVLKIRRSNSSKALRELALQFRCSNFLEFIKTTLATYQQRFVQGLPKRRQAHADFSDPKYGAAALYLCARKRSVGVDRRKLITVILSDQSKFQDVVNSMMALCFDTVGRGTKQAALDVKQKRFLLDATSVQTDHSKTKEQDKKDYDEWRQRVLSASSNSSTSTSSTSSSSASISFLSSSSSSAMISSSAASSSSSSSNSYPVSSIITTTKHATNHSAIMEPPKKKQKVQATLFGAVIPRIGPINKPKIYTDKEHKQASKTAKINMKANAKKLAKENAQNVRDVDESIATLNALLE